MYLAVKEVKATVDYLLILTFENDEVRTFDVKPYLEKGVFRELKDLTLFKKVSISFDTVQWENQLDIDPEVLYAQSYVDFRG